MANKEEILQYIKTLAEQNVVSKDEIVDAYNSGTRVGGDQVIVKRLGIAEILYYIGGAIVFIGISIFIFQHWEDLSPFTRIISTLGSGIAAYVIGLIFYRDAKTEAIGSAFYLISALVMPIGIYVVFDNAGFDVSGSGWQSVISGILFAAYLSSYFVFKKEIFTLFSIIFGTWLFYSFTNYIIGENPYFSVSKFYWYRTLVVGLAYLLLGYFFSKTHREQMSGFLYGLGILGFLGAAFALGGWKPSQNFFWELIFPILVFGALFLSVHVRSSAFLTFGTLFLMAYILKLTSEYFSDSLGWPLTLVIAGLLLIAAGYLYVFLKKKYITK